MKLLNLVKLDDSEVISQIETGLKEFPPNIPMSRADQLLQRAKAKGTNGAVESPTVPRKSVNDGKPAPKDGNAHPPVILVEGAEGAQALQPVAGITPHGNRFQAFNSHLDNLIDPNAVSNLSFGTPLEKRSPPKRGKNK